MSVKLRLTRMGNKKRSFFRIVATNSASRRDGRPLEFLGYYNPQVSPADIKIDTDKVKKWMDRNDRYGAFAHEAVRKEGRSLVSFGNPVFSDPGPASAGRLGSLAFAVWAIPFPAAARLAGRSFRRGTFPFAGPEKVPSCAGRIRGVPGCDGTQTRGFPVLGS